MSKYLHDLVTQLTMREKVHFKMMASIKGNNQKNYLQLYDFIEKTPVYDLAIVREEFKDTTIGKYLSSEYNYLAEQLMKSLMHYHFNKSDKNKIQKSILFINIMIDKGLKKKALKTLSYTKKIAYKNELFPQILILIDLEEKILFSQGILGFTDNLKNLELERQSLIVKINNLNKLRLLREQIREFWFQEGFLNQVNKTHSVLNNSLLESQEYALSLRAKEHWLYIDGMKDYIFQNHRKAITKFRKAIEFVLSHNQLFNENKSLALISNYLYNCALAKDSISFEIGLVKLNFLKESIYTKYISYSRSFELYYQLNDNASITYLEDEVYLFMRNNQDQLEATQSNYLYFLLVRNKIVERNFGKALDYINEWLTLKIIDYFHLHIKMFLLIIYLELGYYVLLTSEIKNTYTTLKKIKQYDFRAKLIVSFFKKILKYSDKELQLLNQLEHALSKVNNISEIKKNYKYFDYLIWVKGRIQFISN